METKVLTGSDSDDNYESCRDIGIYAFIATKMANHHNEWAHRMCEIT